MADFKMPMFDPKSMTFKQFIEEIYEVKSWGLGWNDDKMLRGLAMVLPTGWCTRIFRGLNDAQRETYSGLKDTLIREIDRTGEKKPAAASDFHKLKQYEHESVDDFSHRLLLKVDDAYPSFARANKDELCVHRFIDGIHNPKIKEQLNVVLCQSAKLPKFDFLVDTARRLTLSMNREESAETTEQQTTPVFRVRCHYCNKLGHKESYCRKKYADQNRNRSSGSPNSRTNARKCFACGQRGHIAKYCRDSDSTSKKRLSTVLSRSDDCPIVNIVLGRHSCEAVIDTGAAISCITSSVADKAFPSGYSLTKSNNKLSGAFTTKLPPSLGMLETKFQMGENIYSHSFQVIDTNEEALLIGWDFMCQFDSINFKPKQGDVEFNPPVAKADTNVGVVRSLETIVIPPHSQKILRVSVTQTSAVAVSPQVVMVERDDNFEQKTGLFVGRSVSETQDPKVLVFNPDGKSKTVCRCQTVGQSVDVISEESVFQWWSWCSV